MHSSALHGWIGLDHNRLKVRVSLGNIHFSMLGKSLYCKLDLPLSRPACGLYGMRSKVVEQADSLHPLANPFSLFTEPRNPFFPHKLNSAQAEKDIPNVSLL